MAFIEFRFEKNNRRTFYITLNDEILFSVKSSCVCRIDSEECCIQINTTSPKQRQKAALYRRAANRSDAILWQSFQAKRADKASGEEWVIELDLKKESACVLYLPQKKEDRLLYDKIDRLTPQELRRYLSCAQDL